MPAPLLAAAAGDDAVRWLEHEAYVRALARRHVPDPHAALDLAQDVWCVALSKPPAHDEHLRGWLARVVRNLSVSRARREQRRMLEPEAWQAAHELSVGRAGLRGGDPRGDSDPAGLAALAALGRLRPIYREVLERHYLVGQSTDEIARELRLARETVRTRVKRGLRELRRRLAARS